jgi:flagella basal body P-ring formation protein FlgA
MSINVDKRTPEFVEKLTVAPNARRRFAAPRRSPRLRFLPLLLTLITANSPAKSPDWQPVDEIAATAEAFLKARTGVFAGNTTVQAGNIDPRQRLALCDQALTGFLRSGTEVKARTIVGVRCSGSKPWKVYVPVDVIVTETVLIARKTLNKGHVLTAADIIKEPRDVSRLRSGYISDQAAAVGQRLKTQLIAGKILVPTMFEVEIAIRRGQTVTLTAGSGDFSIAMTGTALMNGAINQRIRVENTHSGRVVEGIVRTREHVEVLMPSNNDFFHAEPKVLERPADTQLSNNDS